MPGHNDRRADESRRPLLLLAIAVFVLHLMVTGGHLMSPDEELLYRQAESIAFRASTTVVPLEADLATGQLHPMIPPDQTFATRPGRDSGVFYAQYLPLQPLLAAPFLYTARMFEGALAPGFAGAMWPSMTISYLETLNDDDYARAVFRRGFLVMFFNPLVAAFSAVVLARLGRLLTGSRFAGLAAAALWAFGTVAWPHSRTFFTEPLAGLFALLAFDSIVRWRLAPSGEGRRFAVLCGVFLALGNWTRVDGPFLTVGAIAAIGALALWRFLREEAYHRKTGKAPLVDVLIAGAIPFGAWLLLQAFNAARFGVDVTSGYSQQSEAVKFSTPLLIGLHGLLMSPGKGMFFFSPALVLGVWGWCRIPLHLRWLRTAAMVVYTPFFIAMAMWQNWDGGWCWGPRHVVQVHLPIMLGAVFLFEGAMGSVRRIAIMTVAAIGAFVQIYGSSQNPLSYYQEYFLSYRDNVYYRVNLRDNQAAALRRDFALMRLDEQGRPDGVLPPAVFPAPMLDSLYLPQHTQWYAYADMWKLGYCDWFFFNVLTGRENPDPMEGMR